MPDTDSHHRRVWWNLWTLPDDVTYLNHGSFGPSPEPVQESFIRWTRRLESQPMNFFVREMEPAFEDALSVLAKFVGAARNSLVFVDNATSGMNVVARSVRLAHDDEVLITDHEYGAVTRLWRRCCQRSGARVVTRRLPERLTDEDEVVRELLAGITSRTRLLVVSHVTSPTALILPVERICQGAKELGVPVCIDGPHAVGMLPLNLRRIDCDFYTASCHKWLSAPFGSGFLYVAPHRQKQIQPAIVSWGGSIGGRQPSWKDEFNWVGTRNPAAFLATADAVRFFQSEVESVTDGGRPSGNRASEATQTASPPGQAPSPRSVLDEFRTHSRSLVEVACSRLERLVEDDRLTDDFGSWCGSMISLPLPPGPPPPSPGDKDPLQKTLWERHRIEIPVIHWNGRRLIRVSAHLYNSVDDLDRLASALDEEL